ncbi:MAG: tripartite tricarboxylate transporter TctB family protein [Lautropia sp.]
MRTGLLHNRDVLAGLLFVGIGVAGFVGALSYPYGNVQEMGPGYFPRVLGLILVGFGLVTAYRGLRSGERVDGSWGWMPLFLIALALVAFGWLMERVGLVPALIVLIVTSARAGRAFHWREVAVLSLVLCVMALAIFVWGLGLPYPLFAFEH